MSNSSSIEVYIDESNTPLFEPGQKSNPYVVCAIAIPLKEKTKIIDLLPRKNCLNLLKASSLEMTDDVATRFLENILNFDIFISLVGVNSTDEDTADIADKLVENANRHRKKKIKKANLMYERTVAQAIINLWGYGNLSLFDLILDSNSLPEKEFSLFEKTIKTQFEKRGVKIPRISRQTENKAPLLYSADIIAGVVRRWASHRDMTNCREAIMKGIELSKIFLENGFEVYNAK